MKNILHFNSKGLYTDKSGSVKKILHIPLNGEYWKQIKAGIKPFEYRLCTHRWKKLLVDREYDFVFFKFGYPKREDWNKIIVVPYRGYEVQTITHPHFGKDAVEVFAIYTQEFRRVENGN